MSHEVKHYELMAIEAEYDRARKLHAPMTSPHHGWAVLREEVDEMWDAVKANDVIAARREALQVAAMALAFLREVY